MNREITEGYKEVLRHFAVFQEAGDDIVWKLLDRVPDSRRRAFRELLDNLSYYERNIDAYAARFDGFDLGELRKKFSRSVVGDRELNAASTAENDIPKILEAGCGTGRDTFEFIRLGFIVTAFDISPAMVRMCSRRIRQLRASTEPKEAGRAGASVCEERAFDEVRYRNEFDGVWASASLLHVPKNQFADAVDRLVHSLKPNGVLFMSFKHGWGEAEFDARHYSYFRRGELRDVIAKIPCASILNIWLTDAQGRNVSICGSIGATMRLLYSRSSSRWVNVLVRKVLR